MGKKITNMKLLLSSPVLPCSSFWFMTIFILGLYQTTLLRIENVLLHNLLKRASQDPFHCCLSIWFIHSDGSGSCAYAPWGRMESFSNSAEVWSECRSYKSESVWSPLFSLTSWPQEGISTCAQLQTWRRTERESEQNLQALKADCAPTTALMWSISIRHNGQSIQIHWPDYEFNSLELYVQVKKNLNFSFGVLQHRVKHTWGFSISVPLKGSRGLCEH